MNSTKIIGGMFGLEARTPGSLAVASSPPAFLAKHHILLATARSAFTILNRTLRPPTVWLPSFLCGVIIQAFRVDAASIRFYEIGRQLEILSRAWLTEIAAGDMVVFIDYFGFNLWTSFGAEARKRGAWVIEDASQAMLNDAFCSESHYIILSPRKFVGVPDGGILLSQGEAVLPDIPLPPPPSHWHHDAVTASELRAEYDHHGGERVWFPLFQKVEANGPLEPFRMSELSSYLLYHAVDWPAVARRRRNNYKSLASALRTIAIMPHLPDDVVPLGFPVSLRERDCTRQMLFAHDIYPPIHWPITKFVPVDYEPSHQLASEIMTLPCDQRYEGADMARIITLLHDEHE